MKLEMQVCHLIVLLATLDAARMLICWLTVVDTAPIVLTTTKIRSTLEKRINKNSSLRPESLKLGKQTSFLNMDIINL